MQRLTLRLTIALITFVIGVIISASWLTNRLLAPSESKPIIVVDTANQGKSATYKGVNFFYDASLASEVKAKVVPTLLLES
jgi:hypothetical protein